jgi:hypothetical protein
VPRSLYALRMDPLRDPRFPSRPQHPDFWRLSEVVLKLDGDSTEGRRPLKASAEGRIDLASLAYLASQRVGLLEQRVGELPDNVRASLAAMFLTGVLTGIEFERAGGHRD